MQDPVQHQPTLPAPLEKKLENAEKKKTPMSYLSTLFPSTAAGSTGLSKCGRKYTLLFLLESLSSSLSPNMKRETIDILWNKHRGWFQWSDDNVSCLMSVYLYCRYVLRPSWTASWSFKPLSIVQLYNLVALYSGRL